MTQDPRLQWLTVVRGDAPLVLSVPHTGIEIPPQHARHFVSPWLARKDTDWWVDRLYDFGAALGATVVRTAISRSIIDANRDPTGASLYPGQATTDLCPTTTFDGEHLYVPGGAPDEEEITSRREHFFDPYHAALAAELIRLRRGHPAVVLYDCHSIRSVVPRLFPGVLPNFNLGTHGGLSCSPALTADIEALCDSTGMTRVTNGRFRGGYTTRHYGRPAQGVHAVQLEIACRSYVREPEGAPDSHNWPPDYDEAAAAPLRAVLQSIVTACIRFAAAA